MTIDGLKITIPSDELQRLLRERATYHRDRSIWYRGQAENLREAEALDEYASSASNVRQSAASHSQKAAYLDFLADHIVPNESYLLGP